MITKRLPTVAFVGRQQVLICVVVAVIPGQDTLSCIELHIVFHVIDTSLVVPPTYFLCSGSNGNTLVQSKP